MFKICTTVYVLFCIIQCPKCNLVLTKFNVTVNVCDEGMISITSANNRIKDQTMF